MVKARRKPSAGFSGASAAILPWAADKVEQRAVGVLAANPQNARWHSDGQVGQIAASIREFGFTIPILVDEADGILAGHGRVLAARRLNLQEVPVIVARGWSEARKAAYMIADNKLTENAEWNEDLLRLNLQELGEAGFDLALTGFEGKELEKLLAEFAEPGVGKTDPDEAPPLSERAVSRTGDLWELGAHRVLCGDATSRADVARLLASLKPNLMVTDPPWGVDYDPDWRNQSLGWSQSRSIGTVRNDGRADWREAWALFPGDVAYTWSPPGSTQIDHFNSLVAAGFQIRMQIVWAKSNFPVGRGDYHVQHEPCWYAVREGKTGNWQGDRTQTTLWEIANRSAFKGGMSGPEDAWSGHGAQKPVECMRRPMENNSQAGDAVYDPFLGSSTSVIAAEQSGRVCYGLEIEPLYIDVGIRRWQNFTGREAVLQGIGETFEQVKARREAAEPHTSRADVPLA